MEQNTKRCRFCRLLRHACCQVCSADEMADVSITGLQRFILVPKLNHTGSHRQTDSHSKPYLHREKKNRIWNKNYPACCKSYEFRGKQSFISDFSHLLWYAIKKGSRPILYSKKSWEPTGR